MCQEVLSRMVKKEHSEDIISGVKLNIDDPSLTHVMFADDIMLFTRAKQNEVEVLNECLERYCSWSGQNINQDKSGIVLSKLIQK